MFLRIQDVAAPTLVSLANTWEQNYHRIRSLYGISDETYRNTNNRLLFGPGQGSTIGPYLWLLCFILVSLALSPEAPKIWLQLAYHQATEEFLEEVFVDDTGLGTNNSELKKDNIEQPP